MNPFFLVFDFGTSRLKGAVSDGKHILALDSEPSPAFYGANGVCEMDMDAAWLCLCKLSQRLLSGGDFSGRIAGVGISGLGEGLWPVDEDGRAVRSAFLWNDSRARSLPVPDISDVLKKNNITPLFPAAPPVLLLWMRENEPENYRRVRWAARCKDWLNFKLTGVMCTDYSDASTASLNVLDRSYCTVAFDLLGIPEAAKTLPELRHSYEVAGSVTQQASALTGIPTGTPVIAGALDAAAISLGSGMTSVGDGCTIFGTCLANEALLSADQIDHSDGLGSFLLPVMPEGYFRMMGTNNGVGTLSWGAHTICGVSTREADPIAAQAQPGSGGVMFLPYLNGERAPFKDAFATGSFVGVTATTTRAQLIRSIYEGIIYSIMDCRTVMPPVTGRYTVSGGASRCDLLCQMTAAALGMEVYRPMSEQPGLDGIVSAIRYGTGFIDHFSADFSDYQCFYPDDKLRRIYTEGFERYLALRQDMQQHWHPNR